MKRIVSSSCIAVILMFFVDGVLNPGYWVKTLVKLLLFLLLPLYLTTRSREDNLIHLLKPSNRKSLVAALLLGILVYLGIMGTYFFLAQYIDLEAIKVALQEDLGVNKGNFIWVAIYISFINSLVEEFFFRGYIFVGLLKRTGRLGAYSISAFLFAIYHVSIIGTWFNPMVFILAMGGLLAGGVVFNYLNERNRTIINSWLVHMVANLGINTVGLIMFGII